jgi:hypothetical protein
MALDYYLNILLNQCSFIFINANKRRFLDELKANEYVSPTRDRELRLRN